MTTKTPLSPAPPNNDDLLNRVRLYAQRRLFLDPWRLRCIRVAMVGLTATDVSRRANRPWLKTGLAAIENYTYHRAQWERMRGDAEQYYCPGVADELIAALAGALAVDPADIMSDEARLLVSRAQYNAWSSSARPPLRLWIRGEWKPKKPRGQA
ncbi:MAG: hypothetical protein FJ100_21920 [Deltaproteobacteria bacterium]|nr:hypothetical protein [Deltaproteobacteria bacterium]